MEWNKFVVVVAIVAHFTSCGFSQVISEYCNPNPCQNGGSCENTSRIYSFYRCDGYFDDTRSSNEYCSNNPNPCRNRGTCVNSILYSFYICKCMAGFYSASCSSDKFCSHHPDYCRNGGSCVNTPGQEPYYICNFMQGNYGNNCSKGKEWIAGIGVVLIAIVTVICCCTGICFCICRKRSRRGSLPNSNTRPANPYDTTGLH
ncbi:uncharacterized protein LOC120336956 [Styela clava]